MSNKHMLLRSAEVLVMTAGILLGSILMNCRMQAEASEISDFDRYVTALEGLEIPEGTRITALGEATHGNREFQQLKREVFEILVRKYDVRALVIEGDFGGCTVVND